MLKVDAMAEMTKANAVKLPIQTASVCPECLKIIAATVFEEDGKVWIRKKCEEHGEFTELYWGSADMFKKASTFAYDGAGVENPNITKDAPVCPKDCGLCSLHKSHTALANLVVTNRCDLNCWYCLPPEEEILVKMRGIVKFVKICDLVDEEIGNRNTEGEFVPKRKIEVLSLDKNSCVWAPVTKLFRRKFNGNFLSIKTSTGRTVRVTEDHMVMAKDGGGLVRKRASELKKTDMLLTAWKIPKQEPKNKIDVLDGFRNLPENESEKIFVHNIVSILEEIQSAIPLKKIAESFSVPNVYACKNKDSMPLNIFYNLMDAHRFEPNGITFGVDGKAYKFPKRVEMSPELARLIGYFIADGHYAKQNIWFTAGDKFVMNDIKRCLDKLDFNYSVLKYDKQGKTPQLVVGNKLLALFFRYVLGIQPGSRNKRLPRNIFEFGEEFQKEVLSGLFNGDGYVARAERHCSMGLGSVSENLIKDTSHLLSQFDIFSRVHHRDKKLFKMANYDLHKIYVSAFDMLKLIDLLDLKPSHKKRLENLTKRRGARIEKMGDFIIDPLKEIESYKNSDSGFVYDVGVDNASHSFLAGDGILLGNCFFFAKRAGYIYEPSLDELRKAVKLLRAERPVPGNALQITGGEPSLRDDILDIVKMAKEEGVDHVQYNTNGIRFSQDAEFVKKLRENGINTVYLSFDGVTPASNPKNHYEIPYVMENARSAGVGLVLVPTIIKGVNDHEIGDIIRFGFRNMDIVRGVNYQPVSLVGRMPRKEREKHRITIPDVIQKIEEQTDGAVAKEDFYPVPSMRAITAFVEALVKRPQYSLSTHFACGMATYVFQDEGKLIPITRFIDIEGLFEYLDQEASELRAGKSKFIVGAKMLFKLNSFIDKAKAPKGFSLGKIIYDALMKHDYKSLGAFHRNSLFIGMMHFQDLYNYDIERVKRCCIHYLTPEAIIPFCAFNVIPEWYRDKVQNKYGVSFDEWEKRTGTSLKHDAYQRDVEALKNSELYRKVYEGFLKE
jgi:hypothetical protein